MSLNITVRPLRPSDLKAILAIDEKISGARRRESYRHRVQSAGQNDTQLNTSLIAEADGRVVGFLLGTWYFTDLGVPETSAVVDTVGVDPEFQDRGVGSALADQFCANMKAAQVETVYTLVDWKDLGMLKFFGRQGFGPSHRMILECRLPA